MLHVWMIFITMSLISNANQTSTQTLLEESDLATSKKKTLPQSDPNTDISCDPQPRANSAQSEFQDNSNQSTDNPLKNENDTITPGKSNQIGIENEIFDSNTLEKSDSSSQSTQHFEDSQPNPHLPSTTPTSTKSHYKHCKLFVYSNTPLLLVLQQICAST